MQRSQIIFNAFIVLSRNSVFFELYFQKKTNHIEKLIIKDNLKIRSVETNLFFMLLRQIKDLKLLL